jgi:glycerophosphoryl diester phosphodiesterase
VSDGSIDRRRFLGILGLGAGALALGGSAGPVRVVGDQYPDVSAMLAAEPFYVAHHGCSRTWPEMSRYAYTQAARAGFGALELSLARTRDGVWFGLHDATLDRTSAVTGKTASELTWAQVQRYRILGSTAADDPTQPDRPYMRWEELIAAYYPSHVIFVDPKHAVAHRAELMAKMDALPGTPQDHLVCKYYGVSGNLENTSGWARLAALRGYRRWGYFYQPDAPDFAAYQGRWDLLGLDYTADDATWAALLGYGKPVIAHVVPNRAAAQTARHRGAAGLMVSGATAIHVSGEHRFRPTLALPSRR